jgi:tetratricopeptide (TPR) repeat protein
VRRVAGEPRRVVRAIPIALALWLSPGPAVAAECPDWIAKAVSVQGSVQTRRAGEPRWLRTELGDTYCVGDMVRVDARSRAAILLRSGAVLRLDQNTTITFGAPRPPDVSWLELLIGAVHFISRVTRGLNVQTPFVNAAVEGTEFWIEVTPDQAAVTVLEGRITASNAGGSLTLERGQAAVAQAGQAPVLRALVVTPSDAVQWALYYPPLLTYAPADFPDRPGETWPELARRSVEQAARGDLEGAFATLAGVPPTVVDPRFLVYRAGLSLLVGRVDEALPDLERALALDPRDSQALALRAIVAVARNDDADALRLAEQAVQLAPRSAAARLALSYAQQARVDLEGALGSAREAVTLEPGNALAHARLAELLLSVGRLDAALAAAAEAVRLDPGLARAHTVLGFAYLT